jgi:SAM-dependent methyltransferase
MAYEHQSRWLAQKALSPDNQARAEDVRKSLRASVGAVHEVIGQLLGMLDGVQGLPSIYTVVDRLADLTRILVRTTHAAKYTCDWGTHPVPEFTDHMLNQYFLWPEHKRTFWLEGAVMSSVAMRQGGRYLELCCGSGFYSDMFYAAIARELVAVDFDPRAIELARRQHARDNVRYEVVDIRERLPDGPFDGVIWDGAIEHFSTPEIASIMLGIKQRLVPGGLFSGYTIAESGDAGMQHPDHEQEFRDAAGLAALLQPHFKHVLAFDSVHRTIDPPRINLFFYASDDVLPFGPDWRGTYRS